MEPFQQAYVDVISGPNGFEQTIAWPYLDIKALVTVGTGCQIELAEAQTLRWTLDGRGGDATPEDISNAFFKVARMQKALKASAYRYSGCLILPLDQQDMLLGYRILSATNLLRAMFPAFDSYPDAAKTGLLEMPFTLGEWGFQHGYPNFRAAVARAGDPSRTPQQHFEDWLMASKECIRNAGNPAYTRRNMWAQGMFQQAAKQVGQNTSVGPTS